MNRIQLGRTGIEVSDYCLGTMTWGRQTPEKDAHAQIERAYDAGVDFMDTAEMYPVIPVLPETIGDTEKIIGNWIARTGRRGDWVIATKQIGDNGFGVRGGRGIEPDNVREAVEGSLQRLQTDYIDLYQFHWPNRGSYHFRQNWEFDATGQPPTTEILDNMAGVMAVLKDLVAEGKIRAFGLSNDSAWGTMRWLEAAEAAGGPRVATMQNEYSLLCRLYDTDMGELSVREDITLLAFSPMAAGFLTGKYQNGAVPEGSRLSLVTGMSGRASARAFDAVDAYLDIARRHGIHPVHLALQWTRTRPFQTIPIFGATTLDQLDIALKAPEAALSDEVLDEVSKAHRAHPLPY